jgi:hypothetical protein
VLFQREKMKVAMGPSMGDQKRRQEIKTELIQLVIEQEKAIEENIYQDPTQEQLNARAWRWKRILKLKEELELLGPKD